MLSCVTILPVDNTCIPADDACKYSHSFFVPRQITTDSVFELGLNNYHWYHDRDRITNECWGIGLYITPFFQRSTKQDNVSRYFLRNNQKCLEFHEVNDDPDALCSLWFGLEADLTTNFNAIFSMRPQRRVYGSYFNLLVAKEWGTCLFWLGISFAVVRAEHKLRMQEEVEFTASKLSNFDLGTINEFTSVIDAFNNPDWNFGKFSQDTRKCTGIDDIQIKLGYDYYYCDEVNHITPYLVGTIPTGKRQHAEYIFEPLVGSKNGSIGVGLNGDYTFDRGENHCFTWLFDIKWRYAFEAEQCRSFDLCDNGDWSRYLLVVPEDQHLDTQSGINILTLKSQVAPRNTLDIWLALHGEWRNFDIEIGYDFWVRQSEKVRIKSSSLCSGYGIFDLAGSNLMPISASEATISESAIGSNKAPSDTSFVELTLEDIDRSSAAHPTALSSTLYAAFARNVSACEKPVLVGIGGQYEFAHNKAALEQWAIWAKLGVIF